MNSNDEWGIKISGGDQALSVLEYLEKVAKGGKIELSSLPIKKKRLVWTFLEGRKVGATRPHAIITLAAVRGFENISETPHGQAFLARDECLMPPQVQAVYVGNHPSTVEKVAWVLLEEDGEMVIWPIPGHEVPLPSEAVDDTR